MCFLGYGSRLIIATLWVDVLGWRHCVLWVEVGCGDVMGFELVVG